MMDILLSPFIITNPRTFLSSERVGAEATLRGREYLGWELPRPGGEPLMAHSDRLTVTFKTRHPAGLLFFTGEWRVRRHSYETAIVHLHCYSVFSWKLLEIKWPLDMSRFEVYKKPLLSILKLIKFRYTMFRKWLLSNSGDSCNWRLTLSNLLAALVRVLLHMSFHNCAKFFQISLMFFVCVLHAAHPNPRVKKLTVVQWGIVAYRWKHCFLRTLFIIPTGENAFVQHSSI